MLIKRCPFTGIINFYSDIDPHIAVGSIAEKGENGRAPQFKWRCYTDDGFTGGIAPDLQTAERRLVNFLALVDTPDRTTGYTARVA